MDIPIFSDLIRFASKGILSVYKNPIVLMFFTIFLIWASIQDLRTMKVKNYQNISFFIVGFILYILHQIGVPHTGFNLGMFHIYGAIVGFLLLFIPGMILNYAFGGDIKFVTVMGFWIGPAAILLVLLISVVLQLIVLLIRAFILKNFDMRNNFPFAPAFSIGYFLTLLIILIF